MSVATEEPWGDSPAHHKIFLPVPSIRGAEAAPSGWQAAQEGDEIDAVVLTNTLPHTVLDDVLRHVADPVLPVVSLASPPPRWADDSVGGPGGWLLAERILRRLQRLPDHVRRSERPEDILLVRIYSRESPLTAIHDPLQRECVRYPLADRLIGVPEIAMRLSLEGLLNRRFFDRVYVCPGCRSSRLSVREECHSCRSPQLCEETIVHHFRCAHEAPESCFRSGTLFECPKCGLPLRHIGLDYDKPGSITRCQDCGDVNDAPTVGFRCLDCGHHYDSAQIPFRDWYSFSLTAAGMQSLFRPKPRPDATEHARPDAFQHLLQQAAREERVFGTPYKVVRLRFSEAGNIQTSDPRRWEASLNLIHDVLHSALREVDVVRQESESEFLLLMPRMDRRMAEAAMAVVRNRLAMVLEVDPGLEHEVIDDLSPRLLHQQAV